MFRRDSDWPSEPGPRPLDFKTTKTTAAPSFCIDYVIAHEVCHLQHPQHDRAFFKVLSQLVPDSQAVKARLEHS